ncbi:MAG: hypothetical protein ACK493_06615 [Planctomycetota bacterium]|jgi:hypothetical protein
MILDSAVNGDRGVVGEQLRQALRTTGLHGQWLLLVENEPTAVRRLREMLGADALVMPCDWRDSDAVAQTIKNEVAERSRYSAAMQLALVGSSRWGAEHALASTDQEVENERLAAEGREFERWVAGAAQMQRQLQQAKRRFAAAVQAFVEKLQDELPPDALERTLQTLFYHAEAGIFLEYDWRQWQFRTLN